MKELQELLQDRITLTALKWYGAGLLAMGFLWAILVTV